MRSPSKPRGTVNIALPYQWSVRRAQIPLWDAMMNRGFKRGIAVWHRRFGKDLTGINMIGCKAHQRVGVYWHAFPEYSQARKAIWDGMTRSEDESDQGVEVWRDARGNYHDVRPRRFVDHFPKDLIEKVNEHEMRINFRNGSIYQIVGMDNYDSLVGPNPIFILLSEYSRANPNCWQYWQPMLAENNGSALFISTPQGENDFYRLYQMAQTMPEVWFTQLLGVDKTTKLIRDRATGALVEIPVVSPEVIEQLRKEGMPEEMIQQEFYCSFRAPMQGAYFSDQMTNLLNAGKIADIEYDPQYPVFTAWDLGVNDSTAIWFCQQVGINTVRLIDYYEDRNKGLAHYLSVVQSKGYNIQRQIAPWDMNMRDHEGVTRFQRALKLGVRFKVLPKTRVEDGIEAARMLLPRCIFDRTRCKDGIAALRSYRKEWDEKNRCYRDKPKHDWASNAADAFRYLAMGLRENTDENEARPDNYLDEPAFV